MAENNPSYVVSLESKFQELHKQLLALSTALKKAEKTSEKHFNSLTERWNKLEYRVGRLEEFRDTLNRERKNLTGWAITLPGPKPSIFCGASGFGRAEKTQITWFETREEAEQYAKLAQLGEDCVVVLLARETLEEVEDSK